MLKQKRSRSSWLLLSMSVGVFTVFISDANACVAPGFNGRFGGARSQIALSNSALDRALHNWPTDDQKDLNSTNRSETRDQPIVGMWLTSFYVGNTSELLDKAIQQFFPGGNELMSSALFAPETGNICFGVWTTRSNRTYRLRHIGWTFDVNGLQGVARINVSFALTPLGDRFVGTYVSDVVDLNGNVIPGTAAQGVIKGTRF